MNSPFVAVLMGSDSDLAVMAASLDVLKALGIACEVKITSAHRTPEATLNYVRDAEQRGCGVFICAAGMAAHLAGAVAANTLRPVIGVPINAALEGLDALLSTVQMPPGVPVATVAIGRAGATNAAYLAGQILAGGDPALRQRLVADRAARAQDVLDKDAALQARLRG